MYDVTIQRLKIILGPYLDFKTKIIKECKTILLSIPSSGENYGIMITDSWKDNGYSQNICTYHVSALKKFDFYSESIPHSLGRLYLEEKLRWFSNIELRTWREEKNNGSY